MTHPHEEFLAAAESVGVDEDAEDVAADDGYGIDEAEGWLRVVDSMPTIRSLSFEKQIESYEFLRYFVSRYI